MIQQRHRTLWRFAARPMLAALMLGGLLLLASSRPTPMYACSCAVEPLPVVLGRADAVIAGTITDVQRPPAWPRFGGSFPFVAFAPDPGAPEVWAVAVDRVWKGAVGATVEVRSDTPATSQCAPSVSVGTAYLIYAMQDGQGLRREICQRLVERAQAAGDLAFLGPGALPQPGPAPAGSPLGPWPIVGVATLLLVALLVLLQRRRGRR